MQKLKFLLGRYGEATVLNTIKGIARTPFLLGKKEHSTWSVSLAWLLDADNFAKVLAGKYCDNNTDEIHQPERERRVLRKGGCQERSPAAQKTQKSTRILCGRCERNARTCYRPGLAYMYKYCGYRPRSPFVK